MPRPSSRRVESGSYPLYRLVMISIFAASIAGMVQRRVPDSIAATGGTTSDFIYLLASLVGSSLILLALWTSSAWRSLQLERIGCLCVATNAAVYVTSVVIVSGVPVASATYGTAAVGIYCAYRALREIPSELRDVRRIARKSVTDG